MSRRAPSPGSSARRFRDDDRQSKRRDFDGYDRGYDRKREDTRDRGEDSRRRDERLEGRDRDGGRERERDSRKYRDDDRERDSRRYRDDDRDDRRRRDRPREEDHDQDRRLDRPRNRSRDRDQDRDRRGGSSRRSASPRQRRSHTRSLSKADAGSMPPEDKSKPNFRPSGLLAAETNVVKKSDGTTTLLKYNEPPEARKPVVGWRLYVFKGNEQVEMLHIHRQSAYLIGRDRTVADIAIDHPSCSKQHAVIQYRNVQTKDEFGVTKATVKPFIIDLESTNGTYVNGEAIPTTRFYELKATDVIKFGQSTREYVLLQEEAS